MFGKKKTKKPEVSSPELSALENELQALHKELEKAKVAEDFTHAADLKVQLETKQAERDTLRTKLEQEVREIPTSEELNQAAQEVAKATRKRDRKGKRANKKVPKDTLFSPYATRRAVPFSALYPDGIMKLDDVDSNNRYSSFYKFDDVGWTTIQEAEREETAAIWGEFLDSLSSTSAMQIWIHTYPITDEQLSKSFITEDAQTEKQELAKELQRYVSSRVSSDERPMQSTRGLVFTVLANSHSEAKQKLASIHATAKNSFSLLDSDSEPATGIERIRLIRSMTRPNQPARLVDPYTELKGTPLLSVRDLCSPSKIQRPYGSSDLVISGKYIRTYLVIRYAPTVRDNFITDITTLPFETIISQYVHPWDTARANRFAAAHVSDTSTEKDKYKKSRSQPERGFFVDDDNLPPDIKTSVAEAEDFKYKVSNDKQHLFSVTTTVSIMADSQEKLDQAGQRLESVFDAHLFEEIEHWDCLREQSFSSALPLGSRELPSEYDYAMLTEALEVYAPFSSVRMNDENGALLGFDADTSAPILYDQSLREDTNSFVLGMPGKGKSFLTKILTIQRYLREPDADIIIIDPEAENMAMVRELGGEVIDLSEASENHINLMEMNEFYGAASPDKSGNPMPGKVGFILAAVEAMASSLTASQKSILDTACMNIYADFLESKDKDDLPTLDKLYEYLLNVKGSPEEDAHALAVTLQRYVTGSFSVFNHKTNVDLNNRLIDFVVTDLSDDLKPLAIMVLLDFVWSKVTENRRLGRRTYLVVDETQLLLEVPIMAKWLDRFFTRGRKWNFYITCITQNIQRMIDNESTLYMLQNTPFVVLTGQTNESASVLAQIYGLSKIQQRTLSHAGPGEGLYLFRNKVIHYDFILDKQVVPELYRIITTKPEDIQGTASTAVESHRTRSETSSMVNSPYVNEEAEEGFSAPVAVVSDDESATETLPETKENESNLPTFPYEKSSSSEDSSQVEENTALPTIPYDYVSDSEIVAEANTAPTENTSLLELLKEGILITEEDLADLATKNEERARERKEVVPNWIDAPADKDEKDN